MAVEAPLRSSTGSLVASAFSPYSDMSASPDSPFKDAPSPHPPEPHLRPSSVVQRVSASLNLISPSDIVGPSPVTSVGTEATEIEDEQSDEVGLNPSVHNPNPEPQLMMLKTNIPDHVRRSVSVESVSVIHAPESFHSWASTDQTAKPDQASERSSPKDDASMVTAEENLKGRSSGAPTPPPLSTNVRPVRFSLDTATPQAQNLKDVLNDPARLRSSSTSSLEKIVENLEGETDADADIEEEFHDTNQAAAFPEEQSEITALRTALAECWTLCNTLANLSSIHRARVFNSSGTPDAHERAWKSCWKLCQRLYDNKDEELETFNVQRMNLDLCRDFCQSLFDIRQRQDEVTDSVLRVSFELNNHLYSAQDSRTLPEAFRERTLDFYITLCHRLMKQRSDLAEETDSLLRACWSLAEMLFSLRQNRRDGRAPDEELLGSAVQACWELCDIFREGWTAVRPDRNTPRPTQTSFFGHPADLSGRESRASNRSMISKQESHKSMDKNRLRKQPVQVPETPVTEFEDTPVSPDSEAPAVPNILVLGTASESSRGGRWSSSASNLSSYSQSSARTSSTATTATAEDSNTMRIKMLIVKAAMIVGFNRDAPTDGKTGMAALQAFVKQLPPGSFGSLPSHATLLQSYKNLVLADSTMPRTSVLPPRGKRASATEIAKAVNHMLHRSNQYAFLRDLFRIVFSFPMEEAESRKNLSIIV